MTRRAQNATKSDLLDTIDLIKGQDSRSTQGLIELRGESLKLTDNSNDKDKA